MAREHDERWRRLVQLVNEGPGELAIEKRAWARDPDSAPEYAKPLAQKLLGKAADIVDEDVRSLEKNGFSEDQIFEFLVSGSVHAGTERLRAGLAALRAGS